MTPHPHSLSPSPPNRAELGRRGRTSRSSEKLNLSQSGRSSPTPATSARFKVTYITLKGPLFPPTYPEKRPPARVVHDSTSRVRPEVRPSLPPPLRAGRRPWLVAVFIASGCHTASLGRTIGRMRRWSTWNMGNKVSSYHDICVSICDK